MKSHMQIHDDSKPHRCTLCDKSYQYRGTLEIHMFTHSKTLPFQCKTCGEGLSQRLCRQKPILKLEEKYQQIWISSLIRHSPSNSPLTTCQTSNKQQTITEASFNQIKTIEIISSEECLKN